MTSRNEVFFRISILEIEKNFQKLTQFEFNIVVGSNMVSVKKGYDQQITKRGIKIDRGTPRISLFKLRGGFVHIVRLI